MPYASRYVSYTMLLKGKRNAILNIFDTFMILLLVYINNSLLYLINGAPLSVNESIVPAQHQPLSPKIR